MQERDGEARRRHIYLHYCFDSDMELVVDATTVERSDFQSQIFGGG
jgi:hypothetical protein